MKKPVKIPAEKIVMAHDSANMEQFEIAAKSVLPWLQEVIDDFEKQQTGKPVSIEVIQELLNHPQGPEDYIREILAGSEIVKVGTVTLSRSRVKEMLEAPFVWQLNKSVNTLKAVLQTFKTRFYSGLELFDIINGIADVSINGMQEINEKSTTYAVTEAEKEAWLIAQEVKERLEYLQDKHNLILFDGTNPQRGVMRQYNDNLLGRPTVVINAYQLKKQVNGLNW